jgi:hypothetical protein
MEGKEGHDKVVVYKASKIKPCYHISLTTSTLIILFSEMLKFSPKIQMKILLTKLG